MIYNNKLYSFLAIVKINFKLKIKSITKFFYLHLLQLEQSQASKGNNFIYINRNINYTQKKCLSVG
jgi:hypothetical protein